MKRFDLSLIVAVSDKLGIGYKGDLPWRIPEEMRYFKERTMGQIIVMGRKTFESFGAKPLPGRINIVISKEPPKADVLWAQSIRAALGFLETRSEVMGHPVHDPIFKTAHEIIFIGGAGIYREAMQLGTAAVPGTEQHRLSTMYITRVHGEYETDTHFPEYDSDLWDLVDSKEHTSKNGIVYDIQSYRRNQKVPKILI